MFAKALAPERFGRDFRDWAHGAVTGTDGLTAAVAAFERGDLTAAAACFVPDATYREAGRAPIRGRAAIAAHFAQFAASPVAWAFAADDVIRSGRLASVVYRFRMAKGGDGPERERAGCAVVRLDESGLIIEWREYAG